MCSWKAFILHFLLLISFSRLRGANDYFSSGAQSAGLAGSSVMLTGLWAMQDNQAGLVAVRKPCAGIFHDRKFLLPQLGQTDILFAFPVRKTGTAGVSFSYFGFELYNEKKIACSYAMSFSGKTSAGVRVDFISSFIAGEQTSAKTIISELGIQSQLASVLRMGIHLYNPSVVTLRGYANEPAATTLRMGLAYTPSGKVMICAETGKEVSSPGVFKTGIEYRASDQVYLRTGISGLPVSTSFGFGLYKGKYKIDFSASRHQDLGYSPQFSMEWEF